MSDPYQTPTLSPFASGNSSGINPFASTGAGNVNPFSANFRADPNSVPVLQAKIRQAEQEASRIGAPIPGNHSWSLLDMLNIARQPITEMLYSISKQAGEGNIDWGEVLKAAVMGVGADLPWLGDQIGPAYKHTSSDVLRLWFPDAPEWVYKVGGLAGDIITDPLTYITFGAAGGAKGAAEAAAKGAEWGKTAWKTVGDEIAQTGVSKFADRLIQQFGGRDAAEAIARGIKSTTKEAGNYGLGLGLLGRRPVGSPTLIKGSPMDWMGGLLKGVGAENLGKDVTAGILPALGGVAQATQGIPIVGGLTAGAEKLGQGVKRAFSTENLAKPIVKGYATQTGLQLEQYGKALSNILQDAHQTVQAVPEVAQAIKNLPNLGSDANNVLEIIRNTWEKGLDVPATLKPVADQIKGVLSDVGQKLVDRGLIKPTDLIENYFPRLYEKNGVPAIIKVTNNPMSASFFKDRVFDTVQDAIEAGFKPVDPINSLKSYLERSTRVMNAVDMEKDVIRQYGKVIPGQASQQVANNFEKAGMSRLTVPGFDNVFVPKEIADKLTEVYKVVTNPTEATKFLGFLNQAQNMWKKQATIMRPGFHVRNFLSNLWTYMFKDGPTVKNATLLKDASDIWKGAGNQTLKTITLNGEQVTHSLDEWYNMFRAAGIHTGTFSRADLDAIARISGKPAGLGKKILSVPETVGSYVENTSRIASGLADMNKGLSIQAAAKNVGKWFNDYGDLTKTEQSLRKIIPFYTWMRKNLANQLTAMFTTPGRYSAFVTKPLAAIDFSTPEMKANLPEWQQKSGAINPLGIRDANGNPLMLSPGMPFSDINQIAQGGVIPNLLGLIGGGLSPLIKLPMEEALNRNTFTGKDIAATPFSVSPVPAVLDPMVEVLPDVIKQRLGLQRDATGRWNGPAKWVYALSNIAPAINMLNPAAIATGAAEGTQGEEQKAPYALASQGVGLTLRPFDERAAQVRSLQQRLQSLQEGNKATMQKTMNELISGGRLPTAIKLQQFRKLLGTR
jgi:hypothetical protein